MVVGAECNTFANKDLVEQYRVQYVFDVEDSFKEKQTYIIAIGTNILMNIISQYVHEQPGKEQWKLWTLTSDFRRSQDDSRVRYFAVHLKGGAPIVQYNIIYIYLYILGIRTDYKM